MNKDELKKRLISACEESNLTLKEVSDALTDTNIYFYSMKEAVLKNTSVKTGKRTGKTERLSNLALVLSAISLLIIIFIEVVVK